MSEIQSKIMVHMENFFPEQWRHKTLNSIVNIENAYTGIIKAITEWDWKNTPSFAIISKFNGIAKTHLAICCQRKYLYDRITENPELDFKTQLFYKERNIFYELMETYKDKRNEFKTEKEIIEYYCRLPFLVIDDLFSNRQNEFARRVILDILDERIDWRGRPTVITSNLTLNEIAAIDNRIASRLSSGILFKFETKINDFRIKK